MITVKLSPVRLESTLSASWVAPILTVNDIGYDLSELPDGATAVHAVLGQVSRTGSDYTVTLTLPHGSNAPRSTRFPEDIIATTNGVLPIPVFDEVE